MNIKSEPLSDVEGAEADEFTPTLRRSTRVKKSILDFTLIKPKRKKRSRTNEDGDLGAKSAEPKNVEAKLEKSPLDIPVVERDDGGSPFLITLEPPGGPGLEDLEEMARSSESTLTANTDVGSIESFGSIGSMSEEDPVLQEHSYCTNPRRVVRTHIKKEKKSMDAAPVSSKPTVDLSTLAIYRALMDHNYSTITPSALIEAVMLKHDYVCSFQAMQDFPVDMEPYDPVSNFLSPRRIKTEPGARLQASQLDNIMEALPTKQTAGKKRKSTGNLLVRNPKFKSPHPSQLMDHTTSIKSRKSLSQNAKLPSKGTTLGKTIKMENASAKETIKKIKKKKNKKSEVNSTVDSSVKKDKEKERMSLASKIKVELKMKRRKRRKNTTGWPTKKAASADKKPRKLSKPKKDVTKVKTSRDSSSTRSAKESIQNFVPSLTGIVLSIEESVKRRRQNAIKSDVEKIPEGNDRSRSKPTKTPVKRKGKRKNENIPLKDAADSISSVNDQKQADATAEDQSNESLPAEESKDHSPSKRLKKTTKSAHPNSDVIGDNPVDDASAQEPLEPVPEPRMSLRKKVKRQITSLFKVKCTSLSDSPQPKTQGGRSPRGTKKVEQRTGLDKVTSSTDSASETEKSNSQPSPSPALKKKRNKLGWIRKKSQGLNKNSNKPPESKPKPKKNQDIDSRKTRSQQITRRDESSVDQNGGVFTPFTTTIIKEEPMESTIPEHPNALGLGRVHNESMRKEMPSTASKSSQNVCKTAQPACKYCVSPRGVLGGNPDDLRCFEKLEDFTSEDSNDSRRGCPCKGRPAQKFRSSPPSVKADDGLKRNDGLTKRLSSREEFPAESAANVNAANPAASDFHPGESLRSANDRQPMTDEAPRNGEKSMNVEHVVQLNHDVDAQLRKRRDERRLARERRLKKRYAIRKQELHQMQSSIFIERHKSKSNQPAENESVGSDHSSGIDQGETRSPKTPSTENVGHGVASNVTEHLNSSQLERKDSHPSADEFAELSKADNLAKVSPSTFTFQQTQPRDSSLKSPPKISKHAKITIDVPSIRSVKLAHVKKLENKLNNRGADILENTYHSQSKQAVVSTAKVEKKNHEIEKTDCLEADITRGGHCEEPQFPNKSYSDDSSVEFQLSEDDVHIQISSPESPQLDDPYSGSPTSSPLPGAKENSKGSTPMRNVKIIDLADDDVDVQCVPKRKAVQFKTNLPTILKRTKSMELVKTNNIHTDLKPIVANAVIEKIAIHSDVVDLTEPCKMDEMMSQETGNCGTVLELRVDLDVPSKIMAKSDTVSLTESSKMSETMPQDIGNSGPDLKPRVIHDVSRKIMRNSSFVGLTELCKMDEKLSQKTGHCGSDLESRVVLDVPSEVMAKSDIEDLTDSYKMDETVPQNAGNCEPLFEDPNCPNDHSLSVNLWERNIPQKPGNQVMKELGEAKDQPSVNGLDPGPIQTPVLETSLSDVEIVKTNLDGVYSLRLAAPETLSASSTPPECVNETRQSLPITDQVIHLSDSDSDVADPYCSDSDDPLASAQMPLCQKERANVATNSSYLCPTVSSDLVKESTPLNNGADHPTLAIGEVFSLDEKVNRSQKNLEWIHVGKLKKTVNEFNLPKGAKTVAQQNRSGSSQRPETKGVKATPRLDHVYCKTKPDVPKLDNNRKRKEQGRLLREAENKDEMKENDLCRPIVRNVDPMNPIVIRYNAEKKITSVDGVPCESEAHITEIVGQVNVGGSANKGIAVNESGASGFSEDSDEDYIPGVDEVRTAQMRKARRKRVNQKRKAKKLKLSTRRESSDSESESLKGVSTWNPCSVDTADQDPLMIDNRWASTESKMLRLDPLAFQNVDPSQAALLTSQPTNGRLPTTKRTYQVKLINGRMQIQGYATAVTRINQSALPAVNSCEGVKRPINRGYRPLLPKVDVASGNLNRPEMSSPLGSSQTATIIAQPVGSSPAVPTESSQNLPTPRVPTVAECIRNMRTPSPIDPPYSEKDLPIGTDWKNWKTLIYCPPPIVARLYHRVRRRLFPTMGLTPVLHYRKAGRPPYSYIEMAAMALENHPMKSARFSEICSFVRENFLFYEKTSAKHWKSNFRNSISECDFFRADYFAGWHCYYSFKSQYRLPTDPEIFENTEEVPTDTEGGDDVEPEDDLPEAELNPLVPICAYSDEEMEAAKESLVEHVNEFLALGNNQAQSGEIEAITREDLEVANSFNSVDPINAGATPASSGANPPSHCSYCPATFTNNQEALDHAMNHPEVTKHCPQCDFTSPDSIQLLWHVNANH